MSTTEVRTHVSLPVYVRLTELDLFAHRLPAQLQNIVCWENRPPEEILVGTGFGPTLRLTVRKYLPKDVSLLDHVMWRVGPDQPRQRIPSPPWALRGRDGPSDAQIHGFLDATIPELLNHKRFQKKDNLWKTTFRYAYNRSQLNRDRVRCIPGVKVFRY